MKSESNSVGHGSSAATGGSVTNFHTGLSKDGQLAVVIIACLGLGLSIGAVIVLFVGQRSMEAKIEAAERRATDMARIAEREGRVAQDSVTHMQISLAHQKIFVTVDDHEEK